MSVIRISQVVSGQVVISDVKDRSGRVLLAAGTGLSDESIKIIKSWGVAEVDVELTDRQTKQDSNIGETDPVKLENAEIELSKRFRFLNKNHPFTCELFRLCLQRTLSVPEVPDDN
ncbi:MAG: hypothetical protein OEY36_11270 [Gammaproteobacteria bacterium]|nr:hypothetical protein [Gammaproteobacteria bacterium]